MVSEFIKKLRVLADPVCRELNTPCINGIEDPDLYEKIHLFIGTWVESFYYVDPGECIEDVDCISKILNMHGEIFNLAIRREYTVNIDEDLFRKAVEKLIEISKH